MSNVISIRAKALKHQIPSSSMVQKNAKALRDDWGKRILERYSKSPPSSPPKAQIRMLFLSCIRKIALAVSENNSTYGLSNNGTSFQFFAAGDFGRETLQVRVVWPSGQHAGLSFEFDVEELSPRSIYKVNKERTWLTTMPWSDL